MHMDYKTHLIKKNLGIEIAYHQTLLVDRSLALKFGIFENLMLLVSKLLKLNQVCGHILATRYDITLSLHLIVANTLEVVDSLALVPQTYL